MQQNRTYQKLQDKKHIFVIAEAGSNWKAGSYEEDLKRAKELIKTAVRSGADAVKFQTFKPETTYVRQAGKSTYLAEKGLNDDIYQMFEKLSMPYEMIPELAKYCSNEKIMFMSTPFSVKDVEHIDPYVDIHKIASYEINHVRLLERLASTNKPIIISSGASTYTEIDFAINLVKKFNNQIALLQCTSKYPCPVEALNLEVISAMKMRYNIPVGLSDHSIDPIIAPLCAIGFGATIIEKHFTLDKNLAGPDHFYALSPIELETMIKSIRKAEIARGNGEKEVLEEEMELRNFATRSIQSIKDIRKGETLQEGINFDILRPGKMTRGLDARFLDTVNGKRATKDIQEGEGITEFE